MSSCFPICQMGVILGTYRALLGLAVRSITAWHAVDAWERGRREGFCFRDDFPVPLLYGDQKHMLGWAWGSCGVEGCLGLRLSSVEAVLAVFSPLPSPGTESSRNVPCVLPWILGPPAPSGWACEAHEPVSYVPIHTCSHVYAPFSEGASDPWLKLQVGEEVPDDLVSLLGGGLPVCFLTPSCFPLWSCMPVCLPSRTPLASLFRETSVTTWMLSHLVPGCAVNLLTSALAVFPNFILLFSLTSS